MPGCLHRLQQTRKVPGAGAERNHVRLRAKVDKAGHQAHTAITNKAVPDREQMEGAGVRSV